MNSFMALSDLDDEAVQRVLERARFLEEEPRHKVLQGFVMGLIFMNPSLRTLSSCQSGVAQLGGESFVLSPGQGSWAWEIREGTVMDGAYAEHIREAIPVLEQYADAFGIRCFGEGKSLQEDAQEPLLTAIKPLRRKPWVNLESGLDHPCQALADWKTLEDEQVPRNGKFVLSWAYHPKPLPLAVPAAVMRMAARRGMDLTVLRPEGFEVPEALAGEVDSIARRHGGRLRETDDKDEATEGAHVVYAKSWTSTENDGDSTIDLERRRDKQDSWCVDESWFERSEDAIFMHCLPLRRNVVAADSLLDGPRSRVIRQAGNRLHAFKSLLIELLNVRI